MKQIPYKNRELLFLKYLSLERNIYKSDKSWLVILDLRPKANAK